MPATRLLRNLVARFGQEAGGAAEDGRRIAVIGRATAEKHRVGQLAATGGAVKFRYTPPARGAP